MVERVSEPAAFGAAPVPKRNSPEPTPDDSRTSQSILKISKYPFKKIRAEAAWSRDYFSGWIAGSDPGHHSELSLRQEGKPLVQNLHQNVKDSVTIQRPN